MFKVSDRGRGIPPEMIDRVFERFETFPNGSRHRGPGLGLSIVEAMVELHGGRVLIDTAPRRGHHGHLHFSRGRDGGSGGQRRNRRRRPSGNRRSRQGMTDRSAGPTGAEASGASRRRTRRRRWRSPRRRPRGSSPATSSA